MIASNDCSSLVSSGRFPTRLRIANTASAEENAPRVFAVISSLTQAYVSYDLSANVLELSSSLCDVLTPQIIQYQIKYQTYFNV